MQSPKDLNKLTSIDEHGSHLSIIPAEVKGYFRRHRNRVQIVLLGIFLFLPWIHIQGQQMILLNIPKREFILGGLIFRSHDAPLIFLILIVGALGLAFVTSIWGRVWCGWACPQTVFIDALYRRIEILVEGKYIDRRRLQLAPWSVSKLSKKALKWILIISISILISHSFAAYFVGSYDLLKMMAGAPAENWNYFLIIFLLTGLVLFDFAWFREQFCVIVCPYGRIQSVLLEPSSLAVKYDQKRGEPRKGLAGLSSATGDCVGCNRCVEVCPTGIDIRNGLQMECIACTACIDACDEIMTKVNKPRGLISYKTLDDSKFQIFKLKTVAYGILIAFAIGLLFYNLNTRDPVEIAVLRGIESPYSQDIDARGEIQIIDHLRLHFVSQSNEDAIYKLQLSDNDQREGLTLTLAQTYLELKSKSSQTWHVFIKAPQNSLPQNGRRQVIITITSSSGFTTQKEFTFLGPSK